MPTREKIGVGSEREVRRGLQTGGGQVRQWGMVLQVVRLLCKVACDGGVVGSSPKHRRKRGSLRIVWAVFFRLIQGLIPAIY